MIFNLFVRLKSRSGINTHADAMKRKIMLEQQFPGSRYTVGKDDQGHYLKRLKYAQGHKYSDQQF